MEPTRETKTMMIASQLEQMILDNTFETGCFLPSQQELATQFNTSSRPVREALKILEAKGLVTISQGRRTEVVNTSLNQYIESISTSIMNSTICQTKLMQNLMQVRIAVATSAARDFTRLEDRKRFLSQMWRSVSQMEAALKALNGKDATAVERFNQAEADFYRTLIQANGNQILISIYESLSPILDKTMNTIKFTAAQLEKRSKDYAYLCEALQNGQTDLAVALVLVTLTSLETTVMDTYPDDKPAFESYA
ncbi:MAG TPA: GntR family transcriptional regulator [Sphaerochaeta sp.]|nr:GntR family transcriptional regulator [Sphaerochaeta sp.]